MAFPIYGKNKNHVPNHQPDYRNYYPLLSHSTTSRYCRFVAEALLIWWIFRRSMALAAPRSFATPRTNLRAVRWENQGLASKPTWKINGNPWKSMENPWKIHGKYMENTWKIHGNPWKIHGKSMEIHGHSMENPWKIHGKSMENTWKSMEIHGKSMEIHGKSMEIHGKSMEKFLEISTFVDDLPSNKPPCRGYFPSRLITEGYLEDHPT